MGAAFNAMMEAETKESLAMMCCNLMDELAAKPTKQFEFLDEDFLKLMNDVGCLGHEKFGVDAFEATGDRVRRIPRHQKRDILAHAREHIRLYDKGVRHDELSDSKYHLAATAFNTMMEFYFSQGG